ncbi:hypothetical protein TWF106_008784 [Orbilia oligospora]|uniref:DUF7918 domain-containing protein n=1 Tax=Orbilia oligospora TaxID=2813651 RepID=A0A6G1M3X4_ORBOL|nr:hypothetical protein TWF679_007231 [Orbilia oligospora]KAF3215277.1 hypothetical protein TWF106_008784 [Orbilia oligospora]KAF3244733.1 hypothetical protein TWF192_007667 [Orbilia oligospora]
MPTNKGVTCDLYIGESKATEHHIATDNETCTAWIVAEEGKNYSVKIDVSGTQASQHKIDFLADGVSLSRFNLLHSITWIKTITVERMADGRTVKCPLLFQNLSVVESDSKTIETREKVIGNIGTLQLSIWRVKLARGKLAFPDAKYELEATKAIKEKLLKGQAVSHCTDFGERTTEPPRKRVYHDATYIDPKDKPFATFIFKYASKALLQAQGYIPITPSPELIDEDLPDLTHQELMREVMRLREQNADIKREIKQEHDSQEPGNTKNKKPTYIDLTGDDD